MVSRAVSSWDSAAEGYARSFARLCAGTIPSVLEALADAPGRRLLDAGCGTGELSGAASNAGFDVLGTDSAHGMVAAARARHPGIRFEVADLTRLPLGDASFDAVTANFVINHTSDPRQALRELQRVLVTDGVAAATIWPYRVSALNLLWAEVMTGSGIVPTPIVRLPPAFDFERTIGGLTGIFVETGCTVSDAREIEVTLEITPADLWAGVEAGIATIGAAYLAQNTEKRTVMAAVFVELVEPRTSHGFLTFSSTAIMASGRKR